MARGGGQSDIPRNRASEDLGAEVLTHVGLDLTRDRMPTVEHGKENSEQLDGRSRILTYIFNVGKQLAQAFHGEVLTLQRQQQMVCRQERIRWQPG